MSTDVRSVTVRMNADVGQYIADIRRSGQETERAFRGSTTAAAGMDRANQAAARSTQTVATASRTASTSVRSLASDMAAQTREGERMRRGLTTLGDGAGKVGLIAAAGLGAVVAVTANFDKAMSRVSAATNASTEDLRALRGAAISAGADTVFSASEAADGITELGKAGLSTTDILEGGLTGALNLAAAGQISVAEAANTTATTLQQFGLRGDQASRVADVLAASANKAMGDVTDMSEALKYVGPVSAQMGLSLEDTAGAIAELAQQGILGSQAGTSLRGMMTALTSPSKLAANTMTGLGISMYDAQGKFVGLDGVAGELQRTMSGLTEAQRNEALGRIFGNEQITAARILYQGGSEAVQDWTQKVTDSGFAAQQAAELTNNLSGDMEQLKGSLETALIETGSSSQGPLRSVVQNLTDIVNGYSGLPGPAKTATSAALGLTAALGGGTFVFAKAIGGLASMQTSLVNMGASAESAARSTKILGRVGVGAAGLGLLAAGLASTNKTMAALSTTAGGAAIGFSVGGPWGAAIGGAIGLVVGLGKSHDDTAKKVATLTSTFDTQTGAITANTAAMVAKQLQDDGLLTSAERLGISTQTVTDAVLGQADAQTQLKSALDSTGYSTTQTSLDNLKKSFGDVAGEQIYAQQQAYALREGVELQTGTFEKSADKAKQLAEAMNGTGEATATAGTAAYKTAEDVTAAAKAQADAAKAANDTASAFFNLGDSLNDSKVSLDGWIQKLEEQADALRNFRRNAEEAADKGLRKGLISALQEAGPEGAMRLSQLADASQAQIGRANKAWKRGQDQINAYTEEVGRVPTSVTTDVNADGSGARSVLTDVQGRATKLGHYVATVLVKADAKSAMATLGSVQSFRFADKIVRIHTVRTGDGGVDFASGGNSTSVKKKAGGGPVFGPGTTTSDSIPAMLSHREYVMPAASVDHYGFGFMDDVRARRLATGGPADPADEAPSSADTKASKSKAAASARAAKIRASKGKAASKSLANFDVTLTLDDSGLSSALDSFKDEIGNVRDKFKDAHRDLSKGVERQLTTIKKQSAAYDVLTQTLQNTRDAQAALAGGAAGSINNDIFGNGLAGLGSQLDADTNDLTGMQAALQRAVANGLDGGLFAALSQSGDTTTAQQLSQLDAAGIQSYEDKFNNRYNAQQSLGQFAGNAAFGAQVATLVAQGDRQTKAIQRLEDRLPGAVEKGAERGSRQGSQKGTADGTTAKDQSKNQKSGQSSKTNRRGGRG